MKITFNAPEGKRLQVEACLDCSEPLVRVYEDGVIVEWYIYDNGSYRIGWRAEGGGSTTPTP